MDVARLSTADVPAHAKAACASNAALQFSAFVLGSSHNALHREFINALLSARDAHEHADGSGGGGGGTTWSDRIDALSVPVRGSEQPLRVVLTACAAAGTLTDVERARLLD